MARKDIEIVYRYSDIETAKVDRSAKTIPISFSSEYPAIQPVTTRAAKMTGLKEGDKFVEILDHDPKNVDLSVLNNRGAFLDEHDEKEQLGVIEKAEITPEKRGLALVKMGADDDATKRFGQMADGIRGHVSAGYVRTKYLGKETLPNGREAHRFAWRALEISSVAVPNDPTVGVGMGVARSYQDLPEIDSPEKVAEQKPNIIMAENIITPEQLAEAGKSALTKDRDRRSKIRVAADNFIKGAPTMKDAIRTIADACCDDEKAGIELFTEKAMEAFGARKLDGTEAHIGLSKKQRAEYSVTRAIRSCMDNEAGRGVIAKDCPEYDYSQEAEKKYGKRASSFWIPSDITVGDDGFKDSRANGDEKSKRDLQVNVFGQGGATVQTTVLTPIIELLRNKMVLRALGIQVMGGLTSNVAIPRQTGAATAFSLSEIAQVAVSTQTLDQIALSPHRVSATGLYSKQLLIQSSIDVENFMREDLMTVNAIMLDSLGFIGSGAASQPLGIINTPGIGSITFGAAATYAKMVQFETLINAANSLGGSRAYVTTPTSKGTLKSAAKLLVGATTVTAVAIWEDNEINGYPAFDTNQIPNNQMVFGNFNSLIMAMFGGLDVVVDPYTKAANGEVVITINNFVDFACRHPQEFVVSTDAANQ